MGEEKSFSQRAFLFIRIFANYKIKGDIIDSVWNDIPPVNPVAKERCDYPTQKPEKLVERIINASTNPGDLVFDCFMGSGTTQAVAMKLGRRFIGADINLGSIQTTKILRESVDGSDNIVEAVNRHNEILEDVIIPEIFHTLYEVKSTQKSENVDMVLLREPKDSGYYEFSANDELVITKGHNNFTPKEEAKSFHADTYCFDSKPEKECFLQYISSNKVKEIYFIGMFTSNQGDLSVQYYDPESKRLRKYYPDFLALMEDGSYQLIEVKGDNKIDDEVVLAKKAAAEEMAVASGIHYLMYAGSTLMKSNVLEPTLVVQQASIDI